MLSIKNYQKVESLEEAYVLNQKRTAQIIGGTMWMRMGSRKMQTAIDLSGLGLDTIEETEDTISIGCMVTLRQLELHPGLAAYTEGAMKEAVRHIVGVQFRNLATIGGSIYGRFGFSDVLTLFMAMDSYVEMYKGGVIPMREFAQMKYDKDILVRVIVKKVPGRFYYQSVRYAHTDLPTLTCAGACIEGAYRVVIGARPARAVMVEDTEGILQDGVTEESAAAFGAYAAGQLTFGSNLRGSAEYRAHLAETLAARAVLAVGGDSHAC